MSDVMIQYCVYFNPSDFPNKYVVRQWLIGPGGTVAPNETPLCIKDSLNEARAEIPRGLFRFVRSPEDDPCIVETWI